MVNGSRSSAESPTIKRRVSKACDACRKSKTKCDGERPCSRCLKENKLCTYSNSNIGYAESKCKKLYNQEYVDLLETRNSLLTKALSYLFRQFDRCVDSGLVQIHPERFSEFRQLQMQSMILNQRSDMDDLDSDEYDEWEQVGSSQNPELSVRDGPAAAWMNLHKNKNLFINKETGKLNVNEIVYSIIPTNVDMAVKSLNYIHGGREQIDRAALEAGSNNKTSSHVYDKLLARGYVDSETLFTSDHSKEGIPEDANIELPKRKRRKMLTPNEAGGIPNSSQIQQSDSMVQILPLPAMADTATMKQDVNRRVPTDYNSNSRMVQRSGNISLDNAANQLSYSNQAQQWYPKLEYGQFDLLESFSSDYKKQSTK
ncbi:hypothetical protein KDRO_B01170 [Kluyveromyces lactis]|nr:hypothetical protein KDRO_B01170 [Kluyveromyces lactis]